ncbi:MAG TPA: CDP-alcohol phosphatidyltransferase family protein [Candidatus Krumholzibacteria bacterium]|nr:CDP-alcohol phosphatidyltransferase family protein [Candidatus Krumholzibacteria bacterium]HPD72921.1 CDP-alcohol phosphatidyltransferase family protein [Candidatus Krumholzibacteria bacterium]HRY41720.1 CDP-alcohol phosphatidyltransferase family protein [Candidatus Krumholzibacteria bacterium]
MTGDPTRRATFVLSEIEKRALVGIARRLPGWVLPDHLTLLGMLGSAVITTAYILSNEAAWWLWIANLGFVLNWFGDSLDGTTARVRRIQRPRYGFYLDHLTDAFATLAIGLGLGLSPYMLLAVGLGIVVGYLILSINVYLESQVLGDFRFGYGVVGPTETRLILMGLNTLAVLVGPIPYTVFGVRATVFDVFGLVAVGGMVLMLSRRVIRNLRNLSRLEPANVVKPDA